MSTSENNCPSGNQKPSPCQLREQMEKALKGIRNKILVMSGKGGVGKSSTAVNLALALAQEGKTVGLLDIDIHGPSIPKMLGIEDQRLMSGPGGLEPVQYLHNLKAISIGFLLESSSDALIWRGPMKTSLIQQFLKDVNWGDLDYLIVDCPPGTGDEPLSAVQYLTAAGSPVTGAVIVTTPQEVALLDVQKSITFCRQLDLSVFGVVENMSGLVCPKCGEAIPLFKQGGGRQMADRMKAHFLGQIPIDPAMVLACDNGKPYIVSDSKGSIAEVFRQIAGELMTRCESMQNL
jgi:ATP-binding protein involved in chromosome partitioning